jgi:hypothetical protein
MLGEKATSEGHYWAVVKRLSLLAIGSALSCCANIE